MASDAALRCGGELGSLEMEANPVTVGLTEGW